MGIPVEKRDFDQPDEQFPAGRSNVAIVKLGGVTHKRITFQPGWIWSQDVAPEVEDKLCNILHIFVHVSGKFRIRMLDHSEYEFGPGDISVIPPGHDAWVVGDEPAVIIDHTPAATQDIHPSA